MPTGDGNWGRYFSSAELAEMRQALECWMSPTEMKALFDSYADESGDNFFIQAGLQFLREAFIASKFATTQQAQRVRLCAADRPDFEVEKEGLTLQFEVTEADVPGRRRGAEYKLERNQPKQLRHVQDQEIYANIESVPSSLKCRARAKAKSGYDPKCSLVIFLNVFTYGMMAEKVQSCFRAATEPASKKFKEVWVLWGDTAYRTWPEEAVCHVE